MSERELPKVGTSVWIRKEDTFLLAKRRAGNGIGSWCTPGGHLEMYETLEENVMRETMEEAGIEIVNIQFMTFTNDFSQKAGVHYVTLHFVADWKSGTPADVEPDKIGDWAWYAWDSLPEPLFYPTRTFIESGYNPLNFTIKQ